MNKKMGFFSGLALATLVVTGCGNSNDKESSSESSDSSGPKGEQLFKNNSCVSCHGSDLKGASGPSLEKVGAKLSAEDIEKVINEGKGSMPSKIVEKEDAKEIAKWLSEKK